jgi:predicted DNA-binding transcriptional regulator AlpA
MSEIMKFHQLRVGAVFSTLAEATMKTEQILVNEHEAAKRTGKAVQSLRNDRHNRRGLPYVKLGRSVRYSLADIDSYIRAHRISFDREDV